MMGTSPSTGNFRFVDPENHHQKPMHGWGIKQRLKQLTAKYYSITRAGKKQLTREEENWKAITIAVSKVLEGHESSVVATETRHSTSGEPRVNGAGAER
jgi:DNA-binding PadR family transcriptional regulator